MLLLILERILEAMAKIKSRRTSCVFHLPRPTVDIQSERDREVKYAIFLQNNIFQNQYIFRQKTAYFRDDFKETSILGC